MGVRILSDHDFALAVLYCSTTDTAFGPVFYGRTGKQDAQERASAFIDWLPQDARRYTDNELRAKYNEFVLIEDEYWKAKEDEDTD